MPQSIKDFLIKDVFSSAGFEANEIEFINAASNISEVEITDDLRQKYHDNMLSKEAALNSPDLEKQIRPKLWAEFATRIDQQLTKGAFTHLDEIQKTTVNEIKNTPDKLAKTLEFLTANKPNDDDSEVQKKYDELILKNNSQQSTYETQISTINDTHKGELTKKDNKFTDYKIDNLVKSEINNYSLIDNIPGGKNYLADSTVVSVRKDPRFVLGLEDSGLVFNDRNDPTKKYFENNKQIVLKQVLEPLMKDWIKNSPGPSPGKPTPTPEPATPSTLTFQQMNAAKARENLAEAAAEL